MYTDASLQNIWYDYNLIYLHFTCWVSWFLIQQLKTLVSLLFSSNGTARSSQEISRITFSQDKYSNSSQNHFSENNDHSIYIIYTNRYKELGDVLSHKNCSLINASELDINFVQL